MTNAILVVPFNAPTTEAHEASCRATTRLKHGMEPLILGPITMGEIEARKANPDEGVIRVHSCLK